MRSLLARSFAALLALPLGACVSFTNGVVDKPIANDERLIGYWQIIEKPEGSMMITANGPTSISITLYEDSACEKSERLVAMRTRIEGRDFLDLTTIAEDRTPREFEPIGYEFPASERLALFGPNNESFTQAVETKELAGTITKPPQNEQNPFVAVKASTADLRQWIAAHPAAMHDKPIEFVRRDPASAPHCG